MRALLPGLGLVGAFGVKALVACVARHSPRFWGVSRGMGGSQDPWENREAEEGVWGAQRSGGTHAWDAWDNRAELWESFRGAQSSRFRGPPNFWRRRSSSTFHSRLRTAASSRELGSRDATRLPSRV